MYPSSSTRIGHRDRRLGGDDRRGRRPEPGRAGRRRRHVDRPAEARRAVPRARSCSSARRRSCPSCCSGPTRTPSRTRRRRTIGAPRPTRRRSNDPAPTRPSPARSWRSHRPGRDGPDHDDDAAPHDRRTATTSRAVGIVTQRPHVRDVRAVADLRPPDGPLRARPGRSSPGTGVLAIAGGAGRARRRPRAGSLLFVALFLLGYGWNLGFVAGCALLALASSLAERTRIQGLDRRADLELGRGRQPRARASSSRAAGYATLGLLGAVLVGLVAVCSSLRRGRARRGHARPRRSRTGGRVGLSRSRRRAPDDPRREHAGAGLDLVEGHVLVGAVGDASRRPARRSRTACRPG